jgi:predicted nucleic acid-binding protein
VTLFVDTSVWSLALRRDAVSSAEEVVALREALESGDTIVTTGLILQELLQGFAGPRAQKAIIERFAALPLLRSCILNSEITSMQLPSETGVVAPACKSARSTRCLHNCVYVMD